MSGTILIKKIILIFNIVFNIIILAALSVVSVLQNSFLPYRLAEIFILNTIIVASDEYNAL